MVKFKDTVYKTTDIHIGNLDWSVYLVHEMHNMLFDQDAKPKELAKSDSAMGMCYKGICKIFISKDMTLQNMKRTIMHEITHAVLYTYGLLASSDSLDEEEICNFMEIHLEEIKELSDSVFNKFSPEFKKICKV